LDGAIIIEHFYTHHYYVWEITDWLFIPSFLW